LGLPRPEEAHQERQRLVAPPGLEAALRRRGRISQRRAESTRIGEPGRLAQLSQVRA
jgi:hypothetical protein